MQILRAESLRPYNTLSLEAEAAALVRVGDDQELARALDWSRANGLPPIPLGEGSNVVLAGNLEALVICQDNAGLRILAEDGDQVTLRVSAGHDWHKLVARTLDMGLYGLENLALIPGTVGAAPIQNIGAYGVELSRFLQAVLAVDIATGEHLVLTREECDFGYRDSVFKGELRDRLIITAVDFCLCRRADVNASYPVLRAELERRGLERPSPADVFSAVVDVRRQRLPDPADEPNAGSFFKNPVVDAAQAQALAQQWPELPTYAQADGRMKLPAAWLIEQAGWKGHRAGGVGVHPGHALVLVNYGGNCGSDLLDLAGRITDSVAELFAVTLEIEPRVYGRV